MPCDSPPTSAIWQESLLQQAGLFRAVHGFERGAPDRVGSGLLAFKADAVDLEKLVAAIDRISLERKVPATHSIWRAALEAVHGPEEPRLL